MVVSKSANLKEAVERIMVGKMLNAGQVCIAPDYLMVPEEDLEAVVEYATAIVQQMYPMLLNNNQYAMVNDRHYARINQNPRRRSCAGIKTVTINPGNEDFSDNPTQKIPPTLIIQPDDEALCMQDEIFGPLLPIKTYNNFGGYHRLYQQQAATIGRILFWL